MKTQFEGKAFEEYNELIADKRAFKKLLSLIKDIHRSPYEGIGKPEPLKLGSFRVLVPRNIERAPFGVSGGGRYLGN
jgi:Txe/YoeB family toxin of Txe-Axe toxin-antitoxin module